MLNHHSHRRAEAVSVIIALGLTATTLAGEVALTTMDPCVSATPWLPLVIGNEADVPAVSLDAAVEQVQAIWATAGVRFVRIQPTGGPLPSLRRQVPVVIKRALGTPITLPGSTARHVGKPLAWTGMDGEGHPAGRIEVSFEAVTAVVSEALYFGKPVRSFPAHAQEYLAGRALGRVLAHEIGHWLFGRAHTRDGLMRVGLTGDELISPRVPALPADWTAPGNDRPLANSSHCGGGTPTGTPTAAGSLAAFR